MTIDVRSDELVKAVMKAEGLTKPSELARKMGLSAYSAPRRVARWAAGLNEPDFQSTIALLSAAGWIREEEVRAALQALRVEGAKAAAQEAEESAHQGASRRSVRRTRGTG